MDESKRVVPYSKGQALADEFGIQFFETSAKSNLKVEEVGIWSSSILPCMYLKVSPMSSLCWPLFATCNLHLVWLQPFMIVSCASHMQHYGSICSV